MRIARVTLLVVLALLTPLAMPSIAGATHPCVQVEGPPDAPDPCPDSDHGMPGPGVDPAVDPRPAPDATVVEGTVEEGVVVPDGGPTVEASPDPGVVATEPQPSPEPGFAQDQEESAPVGGTPQLTSIVVVLAAVFAWLGGW